MPSRTNVLVTGGAGYIGSHTCKLLAGAGYVPVAFDNLTIGHEWAVKWGPLVNGDLADGDLIRNTLREYEIQALIHFAASADVGESMQNPRKYFRNNAANSLNLLEAMYDADVKTLVFSSTCAIYGIPETIPIPENHPQHPANPYGETKLFVERAMHWYAKAYGLRWAALRYFNASGADPDGEIGEVHDPETHLIPAIIQAALGQRPHIEIYGTDYDTPDGTAIRDYIHVTDLGDAHLSALEHLLRGGKNIAFNLGTGQGHSVREVIESVERVSGRKVPRKEGPRRPGDPPSLVADARRASEVLGWHPQLPDLDSIVETAWRWHEGQKKSE